MIKLEMEAAMECEEQDCPHALHVDLCLLVTGGFGFMVPMAPFRTRCPEHRTRLAAPPAQGLIIAAEPH